MVYGTPNVCWVRLERLEREAKYGFKDVKHRQPGTDRGHSAISKQSQEVLFAGSILFSGSYQRSKKAKTDGPEPGVLLKWNNKSGHYLCGAQFDDPGKLKEHVEYQTQWLKCEDGSPLLPFDKFQRWTLDEL